MVQIKVRAVSISKHYLVKDKYVLKVFEIVKSYSRKIRWKAHIISNGYRDKKALRYVARKISKMYNVPIIKDLNSMAVVSREHKKLLREYGYTGKKLYQ